MESAMRDVKYPGGDLLDIKQSAKALGVSTKTIRRYIQAGKISARKVRNVWFVPKSEIVGYKDGEDAAKKEETENTPAPTAQPEQVVAPEATVEREKETPLASRDSDFSKRLEETLGELKQQMVEVDRRLFLISRERERRRSGDDPGGRVAKREVERLKEENERLRSDTRRLESDLADARAEMESLRSNGPKDTRLLKNKSEENEALKATIASNRRGLAILREEVEQYKKLLAAKDATIEGLNARIAPPRQGLSGSGEGVRTTLWKKRR